MDERGNGMEDSGRFEKHRKALVTITDDIPAFLKV